MIEEISYDTHEQTTSRRNTFGIIGLIISAIALLIGLTSPWIIDAVEPPPPPPKQIELSDVIADAAVKAWEGIQDKKDQRSGKKVDGKDSTKADTAAQPQKQAARQPFTISKWLPLAVMIAGFAGLMLGVGSFLRLEDHRLAKVTIVLGAAAVASHWILIMFAVVIVLTLLSFLGIGFGLG